MQQMPTPINRLRRGGRARTTPLRMARKPQARRAAAAPRTAYLVLGMHRSGTSAVTQLLALAGCDLPTNVMPGDEHNAKGYFEPWKIAVFNDERLRAGGSAWDDIFAFPFRPLPAAEEDAWRERAGALFDEDTMEMARAYCEPLKEAEVDTLILGCTHYPLVAPMLQRILGRDVRLVSGGHAVAAAVQRTLEGAGLARKPEGEGAYEFLCTGDVEAFHAIGTRFLQMPLGEVERVEIGP